MANKHAESLCAMMDGEIGQSEARFLLKAMADQPQLVARWKRYHYSRAVLKGEDCVASSCLYDQVAVAIAREPAPSQQRSSAFLPAWLRPVAGLAVAASVAVAAYTLLQTPVSNPVDGATSNPVTVVDNNPFPRMDLRAQPASAIDDPYNSRLQAYVLRHNAVAVPRRGRDLVPYVYLVTAPVRDQQPGAQDATDKQAPRAEAAVVVE